ncbi:conserved hypothetical protein [Cyanobium sp. PCC 7001]|uniref:hypothetical protein n=1 Tax=Cyanobium sp. PCC 7001 TaxID=180281 RepID=UPI0001804B42|nr:hypothetical protein [Cyanobium sp. PCC 7001]EDY37725.1 conserved hypothetical protein [Cyanobium sp. PCC 7001]
MRNRQGYNYDNANWRYAFFFFATGVTPAMDTTIGGEGSTYPWAALEVNNHPLDGGRTYRLRLPPDVPARPGSRSCVCMARWSRGSSGPGNPAPSNLSPSPLPRAAAAVRIALVKSATESGLTTD